MTAWIPFAELPSEMTANVMFFWRRTDLIQPFTCTCALLVVLPRSWRIVRGSRDPEGTRPSILFDVEQLVGF